MTRQTFPRVRMDSLAVMAAYTVLFCIHFLQSRAGTAHWEELHTPTAAALLASGYPWDRLASLQYQPFCGGCTAETLAIYPSMVALGSSLAVWKLIPLSFGLAIVVLVMHIARQISGNTAARIAGLCLLFAPSFYIDNRMIAWGNHFEIAAVIMIKICLWVRWMRGHQPRAALGFGMASGLGFWFCYSSGVVIPVLIILWCRSHRLAVWLGQLQRVALGLAVGLSPWLLSQLIFQNTGVTPGQSLVAIYGQDPYELLSHASELPGRVSSIFGPVFWHSAFGTVFGRETWIVGLLGSLCGGTVTVVMGRRLVRWWRTPDTGCLWSSGVASVIVAYTLAYILLSPLKDAFDGTTVAPDELRYLNPLIPLWSIGMGVWGVHHLCASTNRLRRATVLAWLVPGVATALATMYTSDISLRPLWLTSVRPVAMSARTAHDSTQPIDIVAAVERVVGHPGPRRVGRFVVGQMVAQQLVRGQMSAEDLDSHFQRLNPTAARDIAAGIAHGLQGEEDWANRDDPAVPGHRLQPLLERVSMQTATVLSTEIIRFLRPNVDHHLERMQMGWDPMTRLTVTKSSPPYAIGIARQLGRTVSLHVLSTTTDQMPATRRIGEILVHMKRPYRDPMMAGAGEILGERFGHRSLDEADAIPHLHHLLHSPYRAGFTQGAHRTFWARGSRPEGASGVLEPTPE